MKITIRLDSSAFQHSANRRRDQSGCLVAKHFFRLGTGHAPREQLPLFVSEQLKGCLGRRDIFAGKGVFGAAPVAVRSQILGFFVHGIKSQGLVLLIISAFSIKI